MKFYGRESELRELRRLDDLAAETSQFTVLMGRRRTGKTTLMTTVSRAISAQGERGDENLKIQIHLV